VLQQLLLAASHRVRQLSAPEGIAERIVHDIVDLSEPRGGGVHPPDVFTCAAAASAQRVPVPGRRRALSAGYVVQKLLRPGKSVCIQSPPPSSCGSPR
jgi:hypothetical protein